MPDKKMAGPVRDLLSWTAAILVVGCGGGGGMDPPPPASANCDDPTVVSLTPGQHVVVDPAASNGCFRIPAQGPGGSEREWVLALISGSGLVTSSGVSGPYSIRIGPQGATASAPAAPPASLRVLDSRESVPTTFHRELRERERVLSATPGNRIFAPHSPALVVPPVVGSEATFNVCKTTACTTFDPVTAVARSVGAKVAIYIDKTVPETDPLQQPDFDELARTFDTYHYPIDQNAFGLESDLDANGVVVVLLTDAVNALTPDCTNGRILGYFWGGDMLNITGSNHAEIFYAMVPAPASGSCTVAGRKATVDRLKPTLIHEFQHMISFNQHALVRGSPSEVTWLNEGLSHLAEELGGALIPNVECVGFSSCRSQYTSGDLFNAYDYMSDTEAHFLVSAGASTGSIEERGAAWLFVRWLADQFGTDANGSNVTRALVQTNQQGSANVASVTGQPFEPLVAEWMLAVYLDDIPGFTPLSTRLRYSSWGFRTLFANNCCNPPDPTKAFAEPFPLTPGNPTGNHPFAGTGTLRGGSGRHFSLILASSAPTIDILVARSSGGPVLDPALNARMAVVRIR